METHDYYFKSRDRLLRTELSQWLGARQVDFVMDHIDRAEQTAAYMADVWERTRDSEASQTFERSVQKAMESVEVSRQPLLDFSKTMVDELFDQAKQMEYTEQVDALVALQEELAPILIPQLGEKWVRHQALFAGFIGSIAKLLVDIQFEGIVDSSLDDLKGFDDDVN